MKMRWHCLHCNFDLNGSTRSRNRNLFNPVPLLFQVANSYFRLIREMPRHPIVQKSLSSYLALLLLLSGVICASNGQPSFRSCCLEGVSLPQTDSYFSERNRSQDCTTLTNTIKIFLDVSWLFAYSRYLSFVQIQYSGFSSLPLRQFLTRNSNSTIEIFWATRIKTGIVSTLRWQNPWLFPNGMYSVWLLK